MQQRPPRPIQPPEAQAESWKSSIFFSTTCKVSEGTVDKLTVHIRYPFSDLRQKVKLSLAQPEPVIREFVSHGSYELFSFNIKLDAAETEIISRFDVELSAKAYPMSKAPFPPVIENDSVRHYMQPTALVESSDVEIADIAKNVTALSKTISEAIMRISRFIVTSVKFNPEPSDQRQSAKELLKSKVGRCQDINHLLNALCRSVNIPTRMVLGFSKTRAGWARHAWSEVYDPQFGWFPVDIATERPSAGALDPFHLKLMTGLDASEPEIRVVYDFPAKQSAPSVLMKHSLFIEKSVVKTNFTIQSKSPQ